MKIKKKKKVNYESNNNVNSEEKDAASESDNQNSNFRTTRLKELEQLILKLNLMEQRCVQEKLDEEKWALKDDYIATKREAYKLLAETNDLIRTRNSLQREFGNSVDVIQKGYNIRKQFEILDLKFLTLKDIVKKQSKEQRKKYTAQQIDQRFEELQLLKQHIIEMKNIFENVNAHSTREVETFEQFRKSNDLTRRNRAFTEWRDINEDEEAVISRWRERDREIDQQVEEVGDRIDRLGEIAIQIGEKTKEQERLVANLNNQADMTNKQLKDINDKLKKFLMEGGGFNIICKIILLVSVIGVNGFTFTIISKRLIR